MALVHISVWSGFLEWGANDLHMVQLMPLPPHNLLLCEMVYLFWYWLTHVVLEEKPLRSYTKLSCKSVSRLYLSDFLVLEITFTRCFV